MKHRSRSPAQRRARLPRWLRRSLLWPLYLVLGYWACALVAYRFINPPLTPLMVLRSVENHRWVQHRNVNLPAVSSHLPRALIASEDARFCMHDGVDMEAMGEALEDYETRGRLRGASTITMQVARNIFLWTGGGVFRKALEIPLALLLDATWPKRRILEVYLNIAEWGDGVFGAEAAAQAHFHTTARHLSAREAALLVAVLPNPQHWHPARPTPYLRQRAHVIQQRSDQLWPVQTGCLARGH